MKKKIAVVLLMSFSLVWTACGDKSVDASEQNVSTEISSVSEEEVIVPDSLLIGEEEEAPVKDEKRAEELIDEGMILLIGADGQESDPVKAALNFAQAGDLGNAEGYALAGYTYDWKLEKGKGQDYELARSYYEKAGDGNPVAYISLGFLYLNGQGTDENPDKAAEYFQKAAASLETGFLNQDKYSYVYDYVLGAFYYNDEAGYADAEKGMEHYLKAAEAGNDSAMNSIGVKYAKGTGVEQDYTQALSWFEKAAEYDNATSIDWIGYFYAEGYGVEADADKAMEYYTRAADLGNTTAMNDIAAMYRYGDGVPQDINMALEWYEKSAGLGDSSAMNSIGYIYDHAEGVNYDMDKAVGWYTKAAEAGNATAMANLGYHYYVGKSDCDYAIAKEWYDKAIASGYTGETPFDGIEGDLSGSYDTIPIEGAEYIMVYLGVEGDVDNAVKCYDIIEYTPEEYLAADKPKSKWYGSVAIGYVSISYSGNGVAGGGSSEVGRAIYK